MDRKIIATLVADPSPNPLKVYLLMLLEAERQASSKLQVGVRQISKACKLSVPTVCQALARLQFLGFIIADKRPNRASTYQIIGPTTAVADPQPERETATVIPMVAQALQGTARIPKESVYETYGAGLVPSLFRRNYNNYVAVAFRKK